METTQIKTDYYKGLLKEGEKFYGGHIKSTLLDFKIAIDVFEITKRLPTCNWEDIKHNHVTNYATLWQFTERLFDSTDFHEANGVEYRPIGLDRPSLSFLKWVYEELLKATK